MVATTKRFGGDGKGEHRSPVKVLTSLTFLFFFSSRRRHTRCLRDWSSDVCSSDLSYTGSALALEDAQGGRLVIASIDLIAVTKAIADPVYEAVQRTTGLSPERLILAATHTHYGPE